MQITVSRLVFYRTLARSYAGCCLLLLGCCTVIAWLLRPRFVYQCCCLARCMSGMVVVMCVYCAYWGIVGNGEGW